MGGEFCNKTALKITLLKNVNGDCFSRLELILERIGKKNDITTAPFESTFPESSGRKKKQKMK